MKRGWPERLERPAVIKPVAAYVVRVNAHNRFFDGRICAAPAGNRQCASSERFKLDFCEKGIRRCSWLGAFADQPRMELTDPFIDEYTAGHRRDARPRRATSPCCGPRPRAATRWSACGGC